MSALVVALWKLRGFHKKYSLSVDITKLKVHFAICMELMLIFVMRFFRSLAVSKVYQTSTKWVPVYKMEEYLKEIFYWQITLYVLLVIYQCLLCYLLIGFLKNKACNDCNHASSSSGEHNGFTDNNAGDNRDSW